MQNLFRDDYLLGKSALESLLKLAEKLQLDTQ